MVETFVYGTAYTTDGINLSTGNLVTLTTTGAPVTVWISGYGIHANYGSSYATGFAGSIALLVDNNNVFWPNGYYAQSSYQHATNSGVSNYNLSLVWRGTLSAGTHTFKIASGMAPAGPGGAAGDWGYFGYGTFNVAMVVMENKL
jgi:hypothetical protein